MGFFGRLKAALTPSKFTGEIAIGGKPLYEQIQRIGGGVTPDTVSQFLRYADAGQPERLVDLFNESRERDGHLQSVCGTRDTAVALCDLDFVAPPDATADEKKAVDLCKRTRDDFKNFSTMVEHLTGAYIPGHATVATKWEKTKDGLLLPNLAELIHPRDFIFNIAEGALRYRRSRGDTIGIDLLAEFPGRIVQVQRRIVGDVAAREGLIRVLVWAALFRNWDLRDWLALGEIGWKPYLLAKFGKGTGTNQKEIDKLIKVLEAIQRNGYAAIPNDCDIAVEWPKGQGPSGKSSHNELFDVIGREISKAVLGQTTSVEAGPNGDRGGVQARDALRTDIRESDARATASVLKYHLFAPVVAFNIGPDVRCPTPSFQTEESADQKAFSEAVGNVVDRGLRVPAKWVREEMGMHEPIEGEEILEGKKPPTDPNDDALDIPVTVEGEDDDPEDPEDPEDKPNDGKGSKGAPPTTTKDLPRAGLDNGADYTDDLTLTSTARAAKALAPTVAAMVSEVASAGSYEEARDAVTKRYGTLASPIELKVITESTLIMAHLAGAAAVREDTPELSGG